VGLQRRLIAIQRQLSHPSIPPRNGRGLRGSAVNRLPLDRVQRRLDLPSAEATTVLCWHQHRGNFAWCDRFGCYGVDDRPWTPSGRVWAMIQCTHGVRLTSGGQELPVS
jgi:hypothetical protein